MPIFYVKFSIGARNNNELKLLFSILDKLKLKLSNKKRTTLTFSTAYNCTIVPLRSIYPISLIDLHHILNVIYSYSFNVIGIIKLSTEEIK